MGTWQFAVGHSGARMRIIARLRHTVQPQISLSGQIFLPRRRYLDADATLL